VAPSTRRPGPSGAPSGGPSGDPSEGPFLSPLPVDPAPPRPARRWTSSDIAAEYVYRDAANQIVGRVIRLRPKGFRQQRANGRGGWLWGMDGGQLPCTASRS
jgi:hypothetical protein